MPWVVWITGLPGCGKSTVSLALKDRVTNTVILHADELRRFVTPQPDYSEEEREYVYRTLVFTAKLICGLGHNVIIDATGNRRRWRELARESIPIFYEVYLRCPLEICAERERRRIDSHGAPKDIYKKGEKGWPVPGVNVPYEEAQTPDIVIDTVDISPEEAAKRIAEYIS